MSLLVFQYLLSAGLGNKKSTYVKVDLENLDGAGKEI